MSLAECTYVIGSNATGKSNLLDVFRFLRDICKPQGGGLQKAIADRGGISKLRCLHARNDPEVQIDVEFSDTFDSVTPLWSYSLAFKSEPRGQRRVLITKEEVIDLKSSKTLLKRPENDDTGDDARLTQTHLEQVQTNVKFRAISDFFSGTVYLHLVPQLLKFADKIGGNFLEDDPFGQGFLGRLAKTPEKTRDARLRKINQALSAAVPQFGELKLDKDEMGRPHLKALYAHHRPQGAWQQEDQFSDGTLRLIGMLWSLLESNSLLLLEEPELSLNSSIVEQIPLLMQRTQKLAKKRRQIIVTTHSDALLRNQGIDQRGVLFLDATANGTIVRPLSTEESQIIDSGFSVAEVMLPKTKPANLDQLPLFSS